jgi:hypothetical protein
MHLWSTEGGSVPHQPDGAGLDFTSCDRRGPLPHNHLERRVGTTAHSN